ncbi:hypothetical protein KSC_026830 [Ktedonobacter sp. SOSP1-52]|nr:transposase [Ktedonobacter sp. SOSP1-52]GHO63791.1 hypothetical protein KSC_026830 [Ktedonobacter sp. SOSP1-52]
MELLYERCAGLDVHKKNVKVCLILPGKPGHPDKEIRTSATKTADLLEMRDWLKEQGCTHLAMESTGVYWKPIYNLLEGDFEILVVNAHHLKTVPGRKTDVKDSEWIADLLQHFRERAHVLYLLLVRYVCVYFNLQSFVFLQHYPISSLQLYNIGRHYDGLFLVSQQKGVCSLCSS